MRLAVLASGSGTILEAILGADLAVELVVVDRRCRAAEVARAAGIATELVERESFGPEFDRLAHTHGVLDALVAHGVDLVAMAGYETVLDKPLFDAYGGRVLNTHPSLLPAFPGWHAVDAALAAGVKVTGCTVHVATVLVDAGPILAQEAVPVLPGDTVESLHERIKEVERRLYPATIKAMMSDVKRALLSVYDKTGLEALARGLVGLGFELVSSGGTSAALAGAGIAHLEVEAVTGSPEMLGGRVKTLHPKIHGGILADRSVPGHLADLEANGIGPIDLVVCNLYPFARQPSIEMIDVGGPAMVRAAAKNHAHVGVVVDPADYGEVLDELRRDGGLSELTRRRLARAAFAHTAAYDAGIVSWFDEADGELLPPTLHLALERAAQPLRYGENPHQRAALYRQAGSPSWWDGVDQLAGMALSYLNLYDAEAAWRLVHDLGPGPACAIVKHANPCGVAVAGDLVAAYTGALAGDERSAFGGIVAVNGPLTAEVAEAIAGGPQADVVLAPSFEVAAVTRLVTRRKATRLLRAPDPEAVPRHYRQFAGGLLAQEPHRFETGRDDWRVVTKSAPTEAQWADAELAWRIGGYVKSNSIVLVNGGRAVGIGAGQQSRVDAAELAAAKAAGRAAGGACASDAFYPFRDGVDAAAAAGVAVVIQPGGSLRDDEVVAAADEHGIAMVLTGERHFFH